MTRSLKVSVAETLISYPQHQGSRTGGFRQGGADYVASPKHSMPRFGGFQRVEHILVLARLAHEDADILMSHRGANCGMNWCARTRMAGRPAIRAR